MSVSHTVVSERAMPARPQPTPQVLEETPMTTPQPMGHVPRAFMSYSWDGPEHRDWVRDLAARLRGDGVDVTLDRWHAVPGDQLPAFMERAVRKNDYVLIVCTPAYKKKSDERTGGVGYEGDVMTAEALTSGNQRKFIPILREGKWKSVAPSWLGGKYYIDLHGDPYSEEHYQDLKVALLGQREQAPPLGMAAPKGQPAGGAASTQPAPQNAPADPTSPIKILGVIADEITAPRGDGTPGSGLYAIPFQLSRRPSSEWARLLPEVWNSPPQFTQMHRPRIARVQGDKLILDGTTIDEVENYHRDTLKLVVERTNQMVLEQEQVKQQREAQERQRVQDHEAKVREAANRLKFD